VALVWLWRRHDVWQRAALASFVAPHLQVRLTASVSGFRRILQRSLLLLAVACLFGALAGPELGFYWEKISRRGNEVVFAIDTSRSMLTPDVKPNRLTRAKLAIDDMARQLDGDGIGIVAFAGSAFLVCPLTLDHGAFQQSLDAIDVNTIPLGGTDISSAIVAARDAVRRRPGSDRILILVTDGENLQGDALTAATEAAKQDGLKIYTVGMGTADGELIPLPPYLGGGYVKDESGELVKSHLDESGLKAIAAATGGAYVHLVGQGEDFEAFLRTVFGAVTKHDLVYRQQRVYIERYQWPLAASLVLLLASLMVGTRRAKRRPAVSVPPALLVAIGVLAIPPRTVGADQANTAHSPLTDYNAGTAAYRAGKFPQASQAFQSSINAAPGSDAKRLADQQDAYYNLGNALYRAGQQLERSAPQEAIAKWTDAVKAYETALQLRADDADSRFNRDFVKRKIESLQPPPPDGGGGGGGGSGGGGGGKGGGGGGGQGQPPPNGGKGQPPPPGQGQPLQQQPGPGGQPPPPSQGQQPPPQGQAPQQPPPQQQGSGGQPPPSRGQQPPPQSGSGSPPPPSQGQQRGSGGQPPPPQGQQPPSASQPPPGQFRPQPAQPGQGQPPSAPPQAAGSNSPSEGQPEDAADTPAAPGQMSAEEANALLNSAKSDEHHSLLVPSGPRPPDSSPDQPFKNW
jgi:Ca-activated chloride channel family protein